MIEDNEFVVDPDEFEFNRGFVMIRNFWARDTRVSPAGRALYMLIHSYSPAQRTRRNLLDSYSDRSLRTALKELESLGYIRQSRSRDSRGRLGKTRFLLLDPFKGLTDNEAWGLITSPQKETETVETELSTGSDSPGCKNAMWTEPHKQADLSTLRLPRVDSHAWRTQSLNKEDLNKNQLQKSSSRDPEHVSVNAVGKETAVPSDDDSSESEDSGSTAGPVFDVDRQLTKLNPRLNETALRHSVSAKSPEVVLDEVDLVAAAAVILSRTKHAVSDPNAYVAAGIVAAPGAYVRTAASQAGAGKDLRPPDCRSGGDHAWQYIESDGRVEKHCYVCHKIEQAKHQQRIPVNK